MPQKIYDELKQFLDHHARFQQSAKPSRPNANTKSHIADHHSQSNVTASWSPEVSMQLQQALDSISSLNREPATLGPDFWDGIHNELVASELFRACRVEYKDLWYKFKRFETLALLNLYWYQHELIELEAKIYAKKGEAGLMDANEVMRMRTLLKEYYEAVKAFKKISQMPRPTREARLKTVEVLAEQLEEDHYVKAADALGLMDLTPQALGVEPDAIRVIARHMTGLARLSKAGYQHMTMTATDMSKDIEAAAAMQNIEERTPERPADEQVTISFAGRPYQLPVSKGVDTVARLCVAVIAGIFLLVPMIALSYIRSQGYRLMPACLFTVVFAVALSLLSEAKNQEVMVAVAAYAAVLVVFVGQIQ